MTPATTRPAPSPWAVALALGIVYLVWGSTYLGIAVMVRTLPPLVAAGFRYALSGVILLVAIAVWRRLRGEPGLRLTRPQFRSVFIIGTLLLLGGNGGVVLGEQYIASGIAALIIATTPIWLALFEAISVGERPSGLAIAGLVAGTVGVGIMVVPLEGSPPINVIGIALVGSAAITWSVGSIYARRAPLPRSTFEGAGFYMLLGGLVMLVVGVLTGELSAIDTSTISAESVIALIYLIFFGSILAFPTYTWLINHTPVSVFSTTAYVNPVVAVTLGVLILNEPMTPRTWLAAAIIIGAVVAMVSGRPRAATEPEPIAEPESAT
jgi:drug/metabolite transporter (DMT)-like permease